MYLSCFSGLWWLLSIEITAHRLFSRVASSLLFLRALSLLGVYKLYDHTLFLSLMCGNEIWLGCFFIVRCMDMRLLIEYHFLRALLVRSQVPKWMLYLLYFPSYSGWDPILSWLFSARKRRTYFIFYGIFLWKLYLRAACTQLRDFFLDYSVTYFQFSVSLQLALLRLFAAVILFLTGSLFLLLLFKCKLVQFSRNFYAAV